MVEGWIPAFTGTAVLRVERYDRRDRVRIRHRGIGAVPCQKAVAGRGHDRNIATARTLRGRRQRLRAVRSGECAGGGAPLRGAVADGRAAGPPRRRAGRAEGHAGDPRLAATGRLPNDRPEPALDRGLSGGSALACGGCRLFRQDHDARIRLEAADRLAAVGRYPQSVESGAHAGRQQRRQRRRAAGRDLPARGRHRCRRIDPHPRGVLRRFRTEADLRQGRGLPGVGVWRCRACRTDVAHGRRRGADARCDEAAGFARLAQPAR